MVATVTGRDHRLADGEGLSDLATPKISPQEPPGPEHAVVPMAPKTCDILIGAHLTLQLARHILVIAMLLRDRDAGTAHHRFGGSRWDGWASRLAPAPAPYTRAGIAAAIRSFTTMLDDIAANWDPPPHLDNSPLLELLDAVDQHAAAP